MTGQRFALLVMLLLGTFGCLSKAVYVSKAKIPLTISEATEDDLRFVFSSWKHSALDQPKNHARRADGRVGEHFSEYNKLVHRVMGLPTSHLLIAREPEDASFIYGWIAYASTPKVTGLLYTYVKSKFRRLGVASELKDAMLKLTKAPKSARYFCDDTVHDATFCRWGFAYRPLDVVLDMCSLPSKRRG